ncbi:MAG: plasmid stabilization protein ParE [Burkholderia sp.]|jgi:plasmid stabilization system protein ParE|nr:plasmid stabilization protein ParE [Burkholderia sp.]
MTKDASASRRAATAIAKQFTLLETNPCLGRPLSEQAELREFLIEFGDTGYVALYRHELASDSIIILAFRHQKEAGY